MSEQLSEMECIPCKGGEPQVTEEEAAELMKQIPDWAMFEEDHIKKLRREYKFKNFDEAIDFTNKIARVAEHQGHHPRIITERGKVTVVWWTHAIKGLHRNDFIMAARTESLYS